MTERSILIIGAGQGGFQTAVSLRKNGFEERICLIGEEPELPYQRPPLSKEYLLGQIDERRLQFKVETFYDKQRIVRCTARVTAIDRSQRSVCFASGETDTYGHLVLATGARNRVPALPGIDLEGVHQLRTHADADALRAEMTPGRRVAVIGAGFIGLEFASVAAALGMHVWVIEQTERPMQRVLSDQMATLFQRAHERWGVRFRCASRAVALNGRAGRVAELVLADGESLAVDTVLVGVGVIPNSELAADAGLEVENGIRVDAWLQTADPAISALGDVANFPCPFLNGARVRVESVQNAVEQARCVAARLTGSSEPYRALPWFWSDQGDLKLQIAGLSQGVDTTQVLGEGNSLSVLCFRDGRLVAVESCNRPADHIAARRLLARGDTLTPQQAAQPGFELKQWLAERSVQSRS